LRTGLRAEHDANVAVHGELERVGEQVEHDLLPHVLVHVDWLLQLRTLNNQLESRPVHSQDDYSERNAVSQHRPH
jgi:hypothetical protein